MHRVAPLRRGLGGSGPLGGVQLEVIDGVFDILEPPVRIHIFAEAYRFFQGTGLQVDDRVFLELVGRVQEAKQVLVFRFVVRNVREVLRGSHDARREENQKLIAAFVFLRVAEQQSQQRHVAEDRNLVFCAPLEGGDQPAHDDRLPVETGDGRLGGAGVDRLSFDAFCDLEERVAQRGDLGLDLHANRVAGADAGQDIEADADIFVGDRVDRVALVGRSRRGNQRHALAYVDFGGLIVSGENLRTRQQFEAALAFQGTQEERQVATGDRDRQAGRIGSDARLDVKVWPDGGFGPAALGGVGPLGPEFRLVVEKNLGEQCLDQHLRGRLIQLPDHIEDRAEVARARGDQKHIRFGLSDDGDFPLEHPLGSAEAVGAESGCEFLTFLIEEAAQRLAQRLGLGIVRPIYAGDPLLGFAGVELFDDRFSHLQLPGRAANQKRVGPGIDGNVQVRLLGRARRRRDVRGLGGSRRHTFFARFFRPFPREGVGHRGGLSRRAARLVRAEQLLQYVRHRGGVGVAKRKDANLRFARAG